MQKKRQKLAQEHLHVPIKCHDKNIALQKQADPIAVETIHTLLISN